MVWPTGVGPKPKVSVGRSRSALGLCRIVYSGRVACRKKVEYITRISTAYSAQRAARSEQRAASSAATVQVRCPVRFSYSEKTTLERTGCKWFRIRVVEVER